MPYHCLRAAVYRRGREIRDSYKVDIRRLSYMRLLSLAFGLLLAQSSYATVIISGYPNNSGGLRSLDHSSAGGAFTMGPASFQLKYSNVPDRLYRGRAGKRLAGGALWGWRQW
jgi:hypothetical protein